MLTAHDLVYYSPASDRPIWPPLRFDTQDARFVLLSGPSGCGKSTLLRVLCGLLPGFRGGRLAGRISVLGRPVSGQVDGRMGMLFQNTDAMLHSPRVADELLARTQIAQGVARRPRFAALRDRWLGEVVETFELGALLDRRIVGLSGGEQQRVALAAVLATRPDVVLLDEPTSNLDSGAAAALVKLIALCGERFAARFVAAEHRADHVLALIDGAIRLTATDARAHGREDSRGSKDGGIPRSTRLPATESEGCVCWSGPAGSAPSEVLPGWLDLPLLRSLADDGRQSPQDQVVLTCRNVSCRRAGQLVLDGIDLELRAGEIIGLTGPNGAGKSSLLLLLAGGLKAASGSEIRWPCRPPGKSAAAQVGLLLQNPLHQLFCETVREEVALAAGNAGLPADDGDLDRLLTAADLADLAERPTLTLSYGEQQRTALAAAVSARPPIILLDEPTHGMDAARLEKMIRFLIDARRGGTAFVVASHDRDLLAAFCDRVLFLQDGRLLPAPGN
ncbi:MAG TPA: ATP-binding cassette domain-containing protein [Phycisphaerae bacterium]|nr:ATP-binding cassette domain-containing protein [Phycisphaerae bacterium]